MNRTVLKGDIVSSESLTEIKTIKNGYICLERGRIVSVSDTLPEEFADAVLYDYSDMLIMQSFCDMHLHAPQYPMLGMGMDLPLLEWLNTYTFPEECKYANPEHARRMYRRFVHELWLQGTMRAAVFGTIHPEATRILADLFVQAGMGAFIGLVGMDRNSHENLLNTTEQLMEGMRMLKAHLDEYGNNGLVSNA